MQDEAVVDMVSMIKVTDNSSDNIPRYTIYLRRAIRNVKVLSLPNQLKVCLNGLTNFFHLVVSGRTILVFDRAT